MEANPRHTVGRWTKAIIAPLPVLLLAVGAMMLLEITCAWAQEAPAIDVVTPRLNPTGRVLMMPMPLLDADKTLGEVIARIEPDDSIWIRKDALVRLLGDSVKPEVLQAIAQLPEAAGHISISALAQSGAEIRFEQTEVALRVVPKADLRTARKIPLGGVHVGHASARAASPATFAGYLNIVGGVDHLWAAAESPDKTSLHFDLQSAVRFGDVVLENEAGYDGAVDAEICPHEAICTYTHSSGLKRRNSRLVYDRPDEALRFQAGDTTTRPAGFQRITDIMGVAAERAPRTLQPETANRATATHSFVVELPSQAEISVNGTIVRRLKLQPGNYDLSELTLVTGSNDVEVTLIDDKGERRTINRSTYFDRRLIAEGDSEWSVAGGVPSYYKDGVREYIDDEYAVSGFYRWGIGDRVTGDVNAQADSRVAMAGGGFLAATPWGFFATRTAVSHSDAGSGFAVGADWDLINFGDFGGLISDEGRARQSLRLSAEYRSEDFRLPGEALTTASGLIYPSHDYWLRLSGSYTLPLGLGMSATLAGRYQFGREEPIDTVYGFRGDRYGADVTLSGTLTEMINGSISVGYSNESNLLTSASSSEGGAEFRIMTRAFVRLDESTHVTASHDSLNKQTIVTGYHSSGQGVDRWDATVDAYGDERSTGGALGGTLGYYGNRGEVRLAHNTSLTDMTWSGGDPYLETQRTSLRVGTSIAFADGKIGIGAPVRGGFAIVYPHDSLKDKTIAIGARDQVLARADGWGAAVVPNLPAYSSTTLPIDVDDLPIGYSLGAGAFDVRAPYRGGYALMVGSGSSVSAYGTLVDARGEPLALLSGIAFRADDRANEVAVITNDAGRFAAEGLSPGRWRIEMSGESGTIGYVIDVPEGSDGLLRTGTLRPDGASVGADPVQRSGEPTVAPAATSGEQVDPGPAAMQSGGGGATTTLRGTL